MTAPAKEPSGFLGINAKSIHTGREPNTDKVQRAKAKSRLHELLRVSQSVIYDPQAAREAQHRTCWCQRSLTAPGELLGVRRNVDGSGASLAGVSTCGSVWACPVCSLKVCVKRQGEVAAGMKAHVGAGGYVWLMTNTFPHEAGERPLADMLVLQAKAMQKFQNCRTYKRILGKGIRTGSIKALEITLGAHGWHPHTHSLVFATPDAFGDVREGDDGKMASRLIDELKRAWYEALLKVGLCGPAQMSDVLEHGLDVRGGQYAAEYVAKFGRDTKWGLSRELTMNAAKTSGGQKGAHPFQLLEWAAKGDGQSAAQFREYVEAFTGRRMLTWTPGLKAALGLDELEESDEELAAAQLPEEEHVGAITAEDLSVLTARNMLGRFLAFVSEYCYDPTTAQADIDDFMAFAREHERKASGTISAPYWSSRAKKIYDPEAEAQD
jgi:hypothetical protein